MRIAITGASGNIASYLIQKLKNNDVLLIDRKTDIEKIKKFNPDILYHLARTSNPYTSSLDKVKDIEDNLITSVNFIDQLSSKCKIIFPSSIEVYGNKLLATEKSLPNPQSPYAINKLATEYYIKNSGMKYVILRVGSVYGDNLKNGMVHTLKNDKSIYISKDCYKDYIHIDDMISALLKAVKWEDGIYNIGSGHNYSIEELAVILDVNPRFIISKNKPISTTISISKALKVGWKPEYDIMMEGGD